MVEGALKSGRTRVNASRHHPNLRRCKSWLGRGDCANDLKRGLPLDWLTDKLDRLFAALWIAAFGIMAAQIEPLATQYMARSAAQLAKAEAHLGNVQTGLRYQTMAEVTRGELETVARQTLAEARAAHEAVAAPSPLLRPIALWRWADRTMRDETMTAFVPAVPMTTWAVTYTVLGVLIGFAAYELVKWLVVGLLRSPRRRLKKRRMIG